MGNLVILYDIASDKGTLTGVGDWASGLPVSHLRNDDLAAVARYLDITASPARMVAAFDRARAVNAWALIGHNATSLATFEVGLSDAPGLSPATYAPPAQKLWEPTVVWGSMPWGAFPFDGVDTASFPGAPIAFHVAPQTQYSQYAWLDVYDPSNPAGYFQAARLMIGQGWVPPDVENHDLGSSIRPIDTSPVTRTKGGRRLVGDGHRYRTWEIKLSYQSERTAIGVYQDLQLRLGKRGDMLIIWDPEKEAAIRNRLMLYCALAETSALTIVENDAWDVTLQVEELT